MAQIGVSFCRRPALSSGRQLQTVADSCRQRRAFGGKKSSARPERSVEARLEEIGRGINQISAGLRWRNQRGRRVSTVAGREWERDEELGLVAIGLRVVS